MEAGAAAWALTGFAFAGFLGALAAFDFVVLLAMGKEVVPKGGGQIILPCLIRLR